MGQLGWSARQYYTSSPHEFYAACEGFFDKRKQDMLITRRAAYLTAIYLRGSKDVGSEDKFWPVDSESAKPWQPTKEQYEKIINRYKIKR